MALSFVNSIYLTGLGIVAVYWLFGLLNLPHYRALHYRDPFGHPDAVPKLPSHAHNSQRSVYLVLPNCTLLEPITGKKCRPGRLQAGTCRLCFRGPFALYFTKGWRKVDSWIRVGYAPQP